jgi:hypothetical protein
MEETLVESRILTVPLFTPTKLPQMPLSIEQREQVQAAIAGLHGQERHRERMRLRSRLLREGEEYRMADNAKKAAHGREAYHANLELSRRRGAEKSRQRLRRRQAQTARPARANAARAMLEGSGTRVSVDGNTKSTSNRSPGATVKAPPG